MCSLRSLACLILVLGAAGAAAFPFSARDRAHAFSACAGLQAAEAEHAALVGSGRVAEAAAQRRAFSDLLAAVAPDAQSEGVAPADMRAIRVQARLAHRAALARAAFAPDPLRAAQATRMVDAGRARCAALLLSG